MNPSELFCHIAKSLQTFLPGSHFTGASCMRPTHCIYKGRNYFITPQVDKKGYTTLSVCTTLLRSPSSKTFTCSATAFALATAIKQNA